jgi:hypothetical protein
MLRGSNSSQPLLDVGRTLTRVREQVAMKATVASLKLFARKVRTVLHTACANAFSSLRFSMPSNLRETETEEEEKKRKPPVV